MYDLPLYPLTEQLTDFFTTLRSHSKARKLRYGNNVKYPKYWMIAGYTPNWEYRANLHPPKWINPEAYARAMRLWACDMAELALTSTGKTISEHQLKYCTERIVMGRRLAFDPSCDSQHHAEVKTYEELCTEGPINGNLHVLTHYCTAPDTNLYLFEIAASMIILVSPTHDSYPVREFVYAKLNLHLDAVSPWK